MPVTKGKNGKWRVGRGPAVYKTKKDALKAQRAVYAKRRRGR